MKYGKLQNVVDQFPVKASMVLIISFIMFGCSRTGKKSNSLGAGAFNMVNVGDRTLLNDFNVLVRLSDNDIISSMDKRFSKEHLTKGPIGEFLYQDSLGKVDIDFKCEIIDSLSLKLEMKIHNKSDISLRIEDISFNALIAYDPILNDKTRVLVSSEDWQDDTIVHDLTETKVVRSEHTVVMDNPPMAAGFLTGKKHFNHFLITKNTGKIQISAIAKAHGALLAAGSSRSIDPIFISFKDNSLREMERYANLAAKENDVKLWPENRAVWCTWYAGWNRQKMYTYKNGIGAGIEENIPYIQNSFVNRGASTMCICDDHIPYGDWEDKTRAFPKGLSHSAQLTADAGLIPRVWYPVYWASTASKTFNKHPDWFAKHEDGSPYILKDEFQNRSRLEEPYKFSIFDSSVPDVLDYFESTARIWKDRGFKYVTNDFLAFATEPNHYANPAFSKAEVLRSGLEAIKRGLGDGFKVLESRCKR